MTRLRRLVDLFLGAEEPAPLPDPLPASPKKTIKFGDKVVSADVPSPVAANVFMGHVSPSDIQLLIGVSNFITEEVTPISVFILSPQKIRELRDFLSRVIQAYDTKFGIPPSDDPNSPPAPPTILH